ncbi:MAG: ImmA/IrrE family metallo-endopeptidase [Bacteroidales bacterium]|nr:ImmA/IrrE family metallo-endopeptidase [Bacteroidales bacterium]
MLNQENLKYFAQPHEADNWVWRIENGVGDWINRQGEKKDGDQSFWKLVLWVSQTYLGILNKNVTQPQFAQLLIEECPNAFKKGTTKDKLFHNIEKFRYNSSLKKIEEDTEPEKSIVRVWVSEVETLLTKDVEKPVETGPTLEQRMKEYAENEMATGSYDQVCVRPTYNGKTVSLSLERYISQRFKDENRPSHVIIFECVEEIVTESTIYRIHGKFRTLSSLPSKRLYIVSTHSYTKSTQDEAKSLDMGLVLVNLQYKIDEHCFVLPRSSEYKNYFYYRKMLSGERTMTLPLIACDSNPNAIDGTILYFSMRDILIRNHFGVNRSQEIKAPVLYNDEIEDLAMSYIRPQVDCFMNLLQRCGDYGVVPQCVIDPYPLAESMGLHIERGFTGDETALIDFDRKTITVSDKVQLHYHCARFGVGHDTGHYVLHSNVMAQAKKNGQTIHPTEKGWMEHHANHFASCLLMPAPVVRALFNIYRRRNMLGTAVGQLSARSCCVRECVIAPIARTMNVSVQAMTLRLEKLGLISEGPPLPQFLPAS